MSDNQPLLPPDENQLILERREKLKAIRQRQAEGHGVAFPNDFKPTHKAEELFAEYDPHSTEILTSMAVTAKVAGRMMLKRVMGKASFCTLQDASFGPSGGRIQIYVKGEDVGEELYARPSSTGTWATSWLPRVRCSRPRPANCPSTPRSIRLLTKSLRPMPDKFHGMADQEVKYRQRYVDLMTDEDTRQALCRAQQGDQRHP
jgi:lysyl-tRNA synthetase class 2